MSDPLNPAAAAADNARWCAAMCRSHGIHTTFGPRTWRSSRRTPPFYPDAATLAPDVFPAEVLSGVDAGAGCTVKDSFADLDLSPYGFAELFEASWIGRPAAAPADLSDLADPWTPVTTATGLTAWARSWSGGADPEPFRPPLLAEDGVHVVARTDPDGAVSAGAVLTATGDREVIGVSNVFGEDPWPGVTATADRLFGPLPLVGYEAGDDLAAALRHGFEILGPLRVWLRAERPRTVRP